MPSPSSVPDRGDLVWLNFDPKAGHEQAGRRPALVLSPKAYNQKIGLMLACPVTSKVKGYPFEVRIASGKVDGAVLADQIRSMDWKARQAEKFGKAPAAVIEEVLEIVKTLLGE